MSKSLILKYVNKLVDILFSTRAAGLYMLIFAAAIGIATFIENDYGTSAAQKLVFKAFWFEVLLFLFGVCILVNIWRFRLIQQKKWASLTFHFSIIIIILGAGVTRYFGYEGVMHIRENSESNSIVSAETYLNFKVIHEGKSYSFAEPILLASKGKNEFDKSYSIAGKLIHVKLTEFIPNPVEQILDDENGKPMLKLVISGAQGREEYIVPFRTQEQYGGMRLNFGDEIIPGFDNIILRGDSLFFTSSDTWSRMVMATREQDTFPANSISPLKTRALYSSGDRNFVISQYQQRGILNIESKDRKIKNESMVALRLECDIDGAKQDLFLTGRKGEIGNIKYAESNGVKFGISYGAKTIELPFSIGLRDFILDRYPGTDNPSSYASEVTLMDPSQQLRREQRIYMNHVLDHRGYRFFQSSYDPDEKGTYLSVNHDFWGTWISYIGYILLTIGMLMIFVFPKTRFEYLSKKLSAMQKTTISIFLILFFYASNNLYAADPFVSINKDHADKFGKVLVQDHKGRFKPINSLASEVLRKLAKKDELYNQTPEQILISMIDDPMIWEKVPLIQSGMHPEILKILNVKEGLISYHDFFEEDGSYKLQEKIRSAQMMNPKDQGVFEKALIKIDEKVNIANMIFSGRLLRILPVEQDDNHTWISPLDVREAPDHFNPFIRDYFKQYLEAIDESRNTQDWSKPNALLDRLSEYQYQVNREVLPSSTQVKAELFLNDWNIFGKLRNVYGLFGIISLFAFLGSVLFHKWDRVRIGKIGFLILLISFIIHTIALALRWYISGHAPWSNGYESMIYIAWTTVMAGLIFSRTSLGGLTATAVLAATVLLVAGMSWLDPEITPLVPVLKSYWLTIHVSMEAGSYGFLMLGAVIGMLNLLLLIFIKEKNKERIIASIKELTIISEITVTGGLIMVSIGTYLGGVWANESWGRYWGWDAKETWALVTILVYAFILHMRFIPGLKSIFAYNFSTLFGFATVIMTYYGVNYYLSGLHSYAAGDPVPLPNEVYYSCLVLGILSLVSYIRYKQNFKSDLLL